MPLEKKDPLSYVEELTDEELKNLQLRIARAMDARAEEKRKTLIKNFEEALSALEDAHIYVSVEYACGDCGYQDEHYIYLDNISYS